MSRQRPRLLPAIALCAVAACDGSRDPAGAARADGGAPPPAPDAAASEVADAATTAPPNPTMELPRTPADPRLTKRLVPGPAALVGDVSASCSHAPGSAARWCAFSRPAAGGAFELWVIDLARPGAVDGCVAAGPNTPGAACQRLSADLWTGTSLFGASHPVSHRFEDDTLVFHTGTAPTSTPVHEGPVWAWRPDWPAPRQLTTDEGIVCGSQPGTDAFFCLDAAVIDKDPSVPFDRPRLHEFDLRAGRVGALAAGPLPRVVRVINSGADAAARVRLSPDGAYLVFSHVASAGEPEVVALIALAEIGVANPRPILSGAADWEIARDGKKIYYLASYDRARGERATGTLMLADFPSGANPTELAREVRRFELVGSDAGAAARVDQGVAFLHGPMGAPTWSIVRERANPAGVVAFGVGATIAKVAPDVRHSVFFKASRGATFPAAHVARNDGSGSCQLTADLQAETYGAGFSPSGQAVFWIEHGRQGSESEEGWYARPETCGDRVKFGDFVFGYHVVRDELVVFEGGDLADTTSWLQVTSLVTSGSDRPGTPLVIKEKPDPIFDIVELGAAGTAAPYLIFSTAHGGASEDGVHLHGPLGRTP